MTTIFLTIVALAGAGFRGPLGNGVIPPGEGELPLALEVSWQIPLPGEGLSSPVVVGDRVFVTCSSGPAQDTLHTFCLSTSDGSVLWERTLWATGRVIHHEKTSVAAPSPCTDGQSIYSLFSCNDLACYDFDGKLRWLRSLTLDYPNASNSLGLASSLAVVGDVLIAHIENDSEPFAVGIDTATGQNRWKIDRTKRASWTSPVPLGGGRIGLQGSAGFDAVDAATGEIVWSFSAGASTTPSSAVGRNTVFVPSRGLTALDLTTGEELWNKANLKPGTASPVAVGDRIYVLNKAGVLAAADSATGERFWRTRLEGGTFTASPISTETRMAVVSEREGLLHIIDLTGEEAVVLATQKLDAEIQATPVFAGGALYVRSNSTLWKLQEGSPLEAEPKP